MLCRTTYSSTCLMSQRCLSDERYYNSLLSDAVFTYHLVHYDYNACLSHC